MWKITIHTMRHAFASRLAMRGDSHNLIAQMLQHSNTRLVQRYADFKPRFLNVMLEDLDNAAKSLEGLDH